MREFQYVITRCVGIHHRPAMEIVKLAKSMNSTVTIEKAGGRIAVAANFMQLLGLGVRQGDTVTITVRFGDQEANLAVLERFFKENL